MVTETNILVNKTYIFRKKKEEPKSFIKLVFIYFFAMPMQQRTQYTTNLSQFLYIV